MARRDFTLPARREVERGVVDYVRTLSNANVISIGRSMHRVLEHHGYPEWVSEEFEFPKDSSRPGPIQNWFKEHSRQKVTMVIGCALLESRTNNVKSIQWIKDLGDASLSMQGKDFVLESNGAFGRELVYHTTRRLVPSYSDNYRLIAMWQPEGTRAGNHILKFFRLKVVDETDQARIVGSMFPVYSRRLVG